MKLFAIKIVMTLIIAFAFTLPFFYPSLGSGFLEELEILGMGTALVVLGVFLLFVFLYCKELQMTLELVAPENRASKPRAVWLMFLIPYNFVEDFFIVCNIAKSLKLEAESNSNLMHLRSFGICSGLGWCTAQIVSLAPGMIGKLASLVAIILWVIHWRFIRKTNKKLLDVE